VYAHYNESTAPDPAGNLQTNLDALVQFTENSDKIAAKKKALTGNQTEKAVDDTRKVILKIWDHVTLASQQYIMLKQTDEEYDEKFKARISSFKEEMSKDMNAQMITMVGIFTALAFLIFGSISSLDGIFENTTLPIFKVMSVGLIWGICISNMIFVFLYCIGKMTKLSFKANFDPNATIFQRYPVIWWTNLVLISLLLLSLWGHFVQHQISIWLIEWVNGHVYLVFIAGSIAILALIVVGAIVLNKKTKNLGHAE
jgi:hypothetical protein